MMSYQSSRVVNITGRRSGTSRERNDRVGESMYGILFWLIPICRLNDYFFFFFFDKYFYLTFGIVRI